jgi:hypothetical protein
MVFGPKAEIRTSVPNEMLLRIVACEKHWMLCAAEDELTNEQSSAGYGRRFSGAGARLLLVGFCGEAGEPPVDKFRPLCYFFLSQAAAFDQFLEDAAFEKQRDD